MSGALVHLVRHASHDRLGRVLCGRMEGVSLSGRGRAEAEALAAAFAGREVAAVASSPLARARETAAPIAAALRLPVLVDEGLDEIAFGAWTGRRFDELAGDASWDRWNRERASSRPPGGERMAEAGARALAALRRLSGAAEGRPIVAVSHCDVVKAVVCAALGLSVDRYAAFEVEPASVTTLGLGPGEPRLLGLNGVTAARAAVVAELARSAAA